MKISNISAKARSKYVVMMKDVDGFDIIHTQCAMLQDHSLEEYFLQHLPQSDRQIAIKLKISNLNKLKLTAFGNLTAGVSPGGQRFCSIIKSSKGSTFSFQISTSI